MSYIVNIDPIAFTIGQLSVRWYGLAYLASMLIGWLYLKHSRQNLFTKAQINDLVTYVMIGILLGGRLGYCLFYNLSFCMSHPKEIFMLWHGGMSFHGGVIGVVTSTWYFSKKHGIPMLSITDAIVPCLPIGLFLGRIANFINGELVGRPCNMKWCVIFEHYDFIPRYPSQLFEAFGEGFILLILIALIKRRTHIQGQLSAAFIISYGIIRAYVERFREPDPQLGFLLHELTMGQLLSISMIVIGLILYARTVYPKVQPYGH